MREFGDVCPVCDRQRPYSVSIDGEGKLFGWFTACLCGKTCQLPKVLELCKVLSGEKNLKED